jgi:hypothetical protein
VTSSQTSLAAPVALAGSWLNTNPRPKLIRQVVFCANGANASLQISGTGAFGPAEWGESPVFSFVEGRKAVEPAAFTAAFRREGFSSFVQAYVVKGVLVIVSMSRAGEGSQGQNIFMKEFFYREASV